MYRPPSLLLRVTLAGIVCTVGAGGVAHAQSNEVYLGQVGDTNKLTVDQVGESNTVGGLTDDLRLNQLGNDNLATLRQVGVQNGVGGVNMTGRPGFLTGLLGSTSGLFQRGNQNVLDIEQRSWRNSGGSLIGAIEQRADSLPAGIISNRTRVRQIGGALANGSDDKAPSSGPGNHTIREILQIVVPSTDVSILGVGTNQIDVDQLGLSQQIGQLRQRGAANRIEILQDGTANALRLVNQDGDANGVRLRMVGERNSLGNAEQRGVSNRVSLRVDGSGNFVDQAVQGGLGGVGAGRGNVITASIVGDDNGGEGTGGYRALSAQGTVAGAFASSLEQYGEGNALSLTIGAEGIGRTDGNYFSSAQRGFDNAAYALMTGDGNEFALSQDGDGNQLDITQASSVIRSTGDSTRAGNTALLQQIGNNNLAEIKQSGAGNRLDMEIRGDRNLLSTSQTGSGHRIDIRIDGSDNLRPAPRAGRLPTKGDALVKSVIQEGIGHVASLDITGDENVALMRQTGSQNIVSGIVKGTANTAITSQTGADQVTIFRQFGDLNYLTVRQQ